MNLWFLSSIEDRLQDGVPETIYTLLTCNIKIWILTGDKQETAEEIAKQCKLINYNMFLVNFCKEEEIESKIDLFCTEFDIDLTPKDANNFSSMYYIKDVNDHGNYDNDYIISKIRKKCGKDLSIIIDGSTLELIFSKEELCRKFFKLAISAISVVCCRVSPKEKANVIKYTKKQGTYRTLSIGDGANDVPMIKEAHIGV